MFDDTPVGRGMVCDKWTAVKKADGPQYHARVPNEPYDTPPSLAMMNIGLEPPYSIFKGDVKAAGMAVRAMDTGRVLLIQRSNKDPKDPAKGTWEFPGGLLNDGEQPYLGARREWQEETGQRLPKGKHGGEWKSGVYYGFIHDIASEDKVRLNPEKRMVMNPDDPDGDDVETAAWFYPHQLRRMSGLRDELRQSRPWNRVAKAAGTLYVLSHAKTRYNAPGSGRDKVQSWKDIPLDGRGREEAALLGKCLQDKGIDELHSSDLKRAAQTGQIISRYIGKPVKVSAGYRPWNLGTFAGHSSETVIPKLKPYMNGKHAEDVDGGESFDDFTGRFLPALEKLLSKVEAGKTICLVTHSRNIELIQGWIGGRGYRSKIDPSQIDADKIQPATCFEIAPGSGKRLRMTELADEFLKKDGAPGPAGNIPASNDVGNFPSMPSMRTLDAVGPTLNDVHVDRPLKNISIFYGTRRKKLNVQKADQQKQILYGVVLEPNSLDSQEDFILPDQVEGAAHTYMKRVARGSASVSKLQHRAPGFFKGKASVVPIESFIAPVDFSYDGREMVKKGSWVMALHVEDPDVWQDVVKGKYTGLSVGGTGIRQEMSVPQSENQWMADEPANWFHKQATPQDFAEFRDYSWEGR